MSSFRKACSMVALVPLAFLGCTTTDPQAAFDGVNQSLTQRTGAPLRWMRNEEAAVEMEQEVDLLLRTNLTAQSALAIALLNNRTLQANFEDIGISQAELAEASRAHNPVISASWRPPLNGRGVVNSDYGLTQNLLDLLILPARKTMAATELDQVRDRLAQQVLDFNEEVQTAFYSFQARQQFANRLAVIVEVNEAAADVAQRQFAAGNINSLELKNQQLAFAQSRLDLAKVQAETRAEREKLNRLLGLWGKQTVWQVTDELPDLPIKEPSVEDVEAVAVTRRFDLAAARNQVVAVAYAVNLKRNTRYLPGVNVGVNAERDLDGQWVLGPTLELEIPLFDQGQPELAKLAARYRQARRQFEALAVNIRSEVRAARDALLAARDIATYYDQVLLPQNQQLLSDTLLQYNAMQLGNYDLLLAKQREQQAEQGAIEALRDYWIARTRLQTALGGGFAPRPSSDQPAISPSSGSASASGTLPEHKH